MARFDVPEGQDQPNSPQDVTVQRINERLGTNDQLVCKHLQLRVKRRDGPTPPAGAPASSTEQSLEIETAHATGPEVTLTSDAEKLDAHGNDFFYDAAQKLTILKGVPYMEAEKEGSLIQAPELRIRDVPLSPSAPGSEKGGANPPRTYQQIHANGPGSIHMLNKATDKRNIHAFWNDQLISTRDGELDLLILIGSARFVDDEHEQLLKAETLKVWLLADDKKPPLSPSPAVKAKTAGAPASPESSRRPHHVEALRNVVARSAELNVHDTSRLLVRFTDVPPSRMPPPASGSAKPEGRPPESKTSAPTVIAKPVSSAAPAVVAQPNKLAAASPVANVRGSAGAPMPAGPAMPATGAMGKPASASGAAQPGASAKTGPAPARPIDLTARSVEAEVLRCGERNVLDHLWTEGDVKVRQEPAKPGEKGVYIEGDTLDMKAYPEGNLLVVTGDMAQLQMDKMLIFGPEVNIDQAKNKAWVYGSGAMRMESNTTLEGKPLGRTVPLTIHWSQDMLFQGDHAEFRGNINAEQESALLACQFLQVFFDRPISLKEGNRGDHPPKVRNLVGDKEVRVEDKVVERDRLQKYQLLEGRSITMNTVPRDDAPPSLSTPGARGEKGGGRGSDASEVHLSGPGSVRILQRGGTDLATPSGKPAPGKPGTRPPAAADQEMKLTYVSFEHSMQASNRTNTAVFWKSVRLLNLPCENPYREIDLDAMLASELPPGAMYLRCNRLKVLSQPAPDGKSHQEMEANGQVIVQAKEFTAQADHMTYNEAKDQIIFIGEGGNHATLSKIIAKGVEPQVLRARKIIYIRSTGYAWVDKGEELNGN